MMTTNLKKKLSTLLVSGFVAASLSAPVLAEDEFPDRPISVVVAYGPGGATDFQARIVTMMAGAVDSEGKGTYLGGQPIVVINRPGAGGQVGWNNFVTKAKPTGYELASYNVPHFIAQSIAFPKKVKYNIDNLEPVANWGADPAVFIVGKDSEFNSMADVVKFAKENPGKLTISGAGLYVGHHIAALQLDKAAGIETKYVPAGGGVKAMQFVMGEQTMAGFNNLSDAFRAKDRIKILGVADLERTKEFLPDTPTLMEQGIEVDDSSVNFRGIMAPKGTPPETIDYLAERVHKMFGDKRVAGKMKEGGSPLRIMDRAAVQEMWKKRQAYLTELLADLKK